MQDQFPQFSRQKPVKDLLLERLRIAQDGRREPIGGQVDVWPPSAAESLYGRFRQGLPILTFFAAEGKPDCGSEGKGSSNGICCRNSLVGYSFG